MIDCPSCGALNKPGVRFCANCGTNLQAEEEPTPRRRSGRSRVERSQATADLGKARRSIQGARTAFVLMAALYALGFFVLLRGSSSEHLTTAEQDVLRIAAYIQLGVVAFCITGRLLLLTNPFAWGLALACVMTLHVVLSLVMGLLSILLFVIIAMTVGVWVGLPALIHLKRLLAENPDLYVARRMTGKAGRGSADGHRTRHAARQKTGNLQVTAIAVGVVVLAGFVAYLVSDNLSSSSQAQELPEESRLPAHDQAVEKFRRAWHASDRDAIVAMIRPDVRSKQSTRLDVRLTNRRITDEFPPLTDYNEIIQARSTPPAVKAHWSFPGTRLQVRFELVDDRWEIAKFMFKKPR